MPLDNPANNRQAGAGAGEVFGPMQALEYVEHPGILGRVKADTVVTYVISVSAIRLDRPGLDKWIGLISRELVRVAQQVHKHQAQQAFIRIAFRHRFECPPDAGIRFIKRRLHCGRYLSGIYPLDRQGLVAETGKVQEICHKL